jgi:YgiT-type zinc finger domain-containing protein
MVKKSKSYFDESSYKDFEAMGEGEACPNCGGPLKPEKVNLEEFEAGKLFHMEQVPGFLCDACGEIWVPEPILKEFEKMIEITHNRTPVKRVKKSK